MEGSVRQSESASGEGVRAPAVCAGIKRTHVELTKNVCVSERGGGGGWHETVREQKRGRQRERE